MLAEAWPRCHVLPQGPSRAAVSSGTSHRACCKLAVTRVKLLQHSLCSRREPAQGLPWAACHRLPNLAAGRLLVLHGDKERERGPLLGAPWLLPLWWGKAEGLLGSADLGKFPGLRLRCRLPRRSARRLRRLVPGRQGGTSELWPWRPRL